MSLLVVKSVVCHNKTPAVTMVTCVSSLIIETNGGSRNSLVRTGKMAAKNISFTGSDQKLDRGRPGNEGGVHPM